MKVILSAGMHRSGSTWLFNVLRTIFLSRRKKVYSCFANKYDGGKKENIHIIKIHTFSQKFYDLSDYVFITKRDIRDIAASAIRRNLIENNLQSVLNYIHIVIEKEHTYWAGKYNLEIVYERISRHKLKYLKLISQILQENINVKKVCKDVDKIKPKKKFDSVTQLHPDHITNGHYKKTLSKKVIDSINQKYEWWLKENGYGP
jgi:hypothetical protein